MKVDTTLSLTLSLFLWGFVVSGQAQVEPSFIETLSADPELTCSSRSVDVKATLGGSSNNLAWGGDLGSKAPDCANCGLEFSAFFKPEGVHRITATADLNDEQIEVKTGNIRIEMPHGNITDAPEMPSLSAQIIKLGVVPAPITWTATASAGGFRFEGCLNAPVPFPHEFSKTSSGTGQDVRIDLGSRVLGVGVFVKATTTIGDCVRTVSGSVAEGGTNPLRSEVQAALPHETLRRIACRESGQRQFEAPPAGGEARCPLFGCGGNVGIMQIVDPTLDDAWNWRANVAKGTEVFDAKVDAARDYPHKVRTSEEFNRLVFEFNERRQQRNLSPIQVELPDFSEGNFNHNLQQLELDAIRGYNGWFGSDRFGFELHEFWVAIDEIDGKDVLRVANIDEQVLRGEAIWERVPVEERPILGRCNDPDYVNNVVSIPILSGCGGTPMGFCEIEITPKQGPELSFSPPKSETGEETFSAKLSANSDLPQSREITWGSVSLPGTVKLVAVSTDELRIQVKARRPNQAGLRVQVEDGGDIICWGCAFISVPQFFHIEFLDDFQTDLEMVGLGELRKEVTDEIFRTVSAIYKDVNVRFTETNPTNIVGADNFTSVAVGGRHPSESIFGICTTCTQLPDSDNKNPADKIRVFSEMFAVRTHDLTVETHYRAIFDEIAPGSGGMPAGPGEFVTGGPIDPSTPQGRREITIKAAVLAFGRMVGTVIAHESGHALGLVPLMLWDQPHDHNPGDNGLLMDAGFHQDFRNRTGIVNFNKELGILDIGEPVRFRPEHLDILKKILPADMGRFPCKP